MAEPAERALAKNALPKHCATMDAPQASTDAETEVPASRLDARGANAINYLVKNTGANSIDARIVGFPLSTNKPEWRCLTTPDLSDGWDGRIGAKKKIVLSLSRLTIALSGRGSDENMSILQFDRRSPKSYSQ